MTTRRAFLKQIIVGAAGISVPLSVAGSVDATGKWANRRIYSHKLVSDLVQRRAGRRWHQAMQITTRAAMMPDTRSQYYVNSEAHAEQAIALLQGAGRTIAGVMRREGNKLTLANGSTIEVLALD